MRKKIALLLALFLSTFTGNLAASTFERQASAAQGSEGFTQGLGMPNLCGHLTVTVYGPSGTIGATRCGEKSAVCVTDESAQCTQTVYNPEGDSVNFPTCWVGSTTDAAGFASCKWDNDTPAP